MKKDSHENQRVPLYLWKKVEDLVRQYKTDLSEEEFVAIMADVQKEFKIRDGTSKKETDMQFLNKVDARIRIILKERYAQEGTDYDTKS